MLNPYLLKCWCSIKTVATCSTICPVFKMLDTHTHTKGGKRARKDSREAVGSNPVRVNYPYEFTVLK